MFVLSFSSGNRIGVITFGIFRVTTINHQECIKFVPQNNPSDVMWRISSCESSRKIQGQTQTQSGEEMQDTWGKIQERRMMICSHHQHWKWSKSFTRQCWSGELWKKCQTELNVVVTAVSGPVVRHMDKTHTRYDTNGYLRITHDRGRCNGIEMISRDSLNKSSLFRYFILCVVWLD